MGKKIGGFSFLWLIYQRGFGVLLRRNL